MPKEFEIVLPSLTALTQYRTFAKSMNVKDEICAHIFGAFCQFSIKKSLFPTWVLAQDVLFLVILFVVMVRRALGRHKINIKMLKMSHYFFLLFFRAISFLLL